MIRKIVKIDEDKCNGCGLCISGCHEGALKLIDGKAKLITDSYCDGLGACLPACPVDAISIIEREADEFDEEAVKENMSKAAEAKSNDSNIRASVNIPFKVQTPHLGCVCPGSHSRVIEKKATVKNTAPTMVEQSSESQLRQWPVQIKLVPPTAPYFDNCHLLVAADCTAYAYANIHKDYMKNKITIIGCPKLDDMNYAEKLTQIFKMHEIKSITVLRMEVPCCAGIVNYVKNALSQCGKLIPWNVVTISTDGNIIEE